MDHALGFVSGMGLTRFGPILIRSKSHALGLVLLGLKSHGLGLLFSGCYSFLYRDQGMFGCCFWKLLKSFQKQFFQFKKKKIVFRNWILETVFVLKNKKKQKNMFG